MQTTFLQPSLTPDDLRTLQGHLERGTRGLAILPPHLDPEPLKKRVEAALSGGRGADVVLTTSGSRSARPRLVGLSWKALLASATLTNQTIGTGRWWINLPPHHIAGFQIILRSVLAGTIPTLAAEDANLCSLVPTQLRRLSDSDLAHFDTILVGGAPVESSDRSRPLPLVTTYGMTETCGGCVYDQEPLPGVQIRLRQEVVELAGPMLMDGYLDDPSPFTSDGWLSTSDLGRIEDGKLTLIGRADDVIISGGENISAHAVAQVARVALPGLEIEVVGVPDPKWGQIVGAVVVGDPAELTPVLQDAVRTGLGPWAVPKRVVAVPQLPLLSNGKIDHQALLALLR